ncbi:MAG: hypothetical protein HY609_01845 [Deltaproteobacteria bacterium]|nr:hypothetical protein [Deltaproteobacteria bacterium]MBI4223649.1 hypothetical protein [Deltaproteobacteria bacterium]
MAIGFLAPVKINVNERPSQMLYRLGDEASEGGSVYTGREREQLHSLYQHWTQKNLQPLRQLPEHHVLGELNALKTIEALGRPTSTQAGTTVFLGLWSAHPWATSAIAAVSIAIWASFHQVGRWKISTKNLAVETLIHKLETLELKRKGGQISEPEFQQKRRELLTKFQNGQPLD